MAPLLFLWIAFVDTRWMMQDKKTKNVKKRWGGEEGEEGFKTF